MKTLVIESNKLGGQIVHSSAIKNYLGFPKISGPKLIARSVRQAKMFGAEFIQGKIVSFDKTNYKVYLDDGREYTYRAFVIAAGVSYRMLNIPALNKYTGDKVFYGSGVIDQAQSCKGKDVFIVGGANSAGQAAIHLAQTARTVTILIRGSDIRKAMSEYLAQEVENTSNIAVWTNSEIVDADGHDSLDHIHICKDGITLCIKCHSVYVFIGAKPATEWLQPYIACSTDGYIHVDTCGMTNCTGIFAIGDIVAGSVKRVAAAVGQGSTVVSFIHQYLAEKE